MSKKRSFDNDTIMPPVILKPDWSLEWSKEHRRKGKRADRPNHQGYLVVKYMGYLFLAHRLVWRLHYGRWPDGLIDHADCNRSNNAIHNLREATVSQNRHNSNKVNSTSGFRGVCWNKNVGKWQAQIGVNGRKLYLGLFDHPEDGAEAYREAAKKHFGEFAR